jgi:hypothetical protein
VPEVLPDEDQVIRSLFLSDGAQQEHNVTDHPNISVLQF